MKILQLVPELNVGGVETGVVDLAKALRRSGHQPYVCSHGGALVEELRAAGIPHLTLPIHDKWPWRWLWCVRELAAFIRNEGIEIVHARSRVPGVLGYLACRATRAVFLTTCHGYYRPHRLSAVMGWGKLVIVPSDVIGRHMMETFHVPLERLRVVPRGADLERLVFTSPRERPQGHWKIGIIGRVTPLKGHTVLLHAMARLVRAVPNVQLLVVGEAPSHKHQYRQELELLSKRLGLTRYVQWLGTRRDIPVLLKELDLLVMPSTRPESFGRAIIEAQAAGVPVVASHLGGPAQIIDHGTTGLLVPPNDGASLAEAMAALLRDRRQAADLAAAARQKVEQVYSLQRMTELTIAVYEEALKQERILVIKMSSIGDVILISPSLRALRRRYPQARIVALVGMAARSVLQRCPYIDELIAYDSRGKDRGFTGYWRLVQLLRRHGFDWSVDFQNNRFSHLTALLSGVTRRYGYDRGRFRRLLTHRAPYQPSVHGPVAHQQPVLDLLNIGLPPEEQLLELWPGPEDEAAVDGLFGSFWLGPRQRLIGIQPGASPQWASKRWEPKRWAAVCDALAQDNVRVVLTGSRHDVALTQEIARYARSQPMVAAGRTSLMELAVLIKRCAVFVTLDSAPLHIAAAMGTPSIALFGPTDPARHQPPARALQVLYKRVACSPCYRRSCPLPLHHHMKCMRQIGVEEVVEAVRRALGSDHVAKWRSDEVKAHVGT